MVIASTWERGYGFVVKIWHSLEFMTVYAHNRENIVQVGEWVEQGQVIASVGSTTRFSGSLHRGASPWRAPLRGTGESRDDGGNLPGPLRRHPG
jgi:murein DD-endopeptidase MepM/ murein hydrolase activator NlpD